MPHVGQLSETPNARWIVLAGLWLVYASFGLIMTSAAPLVTPILADLQLSHGAMGSIMGAWQLVYIGAAIPCGILLDRIGGRRALILGCLLIGLSGLGRALALDYWTLLLAVMIFGLGGPIISSGAPKMVSELFSGSQRGLAMGIYMTGPALGGVVSLSLTNAWLMPMFEHNWRDVLLVWAGTAGLAMLVWMLIGWLYVRDAPTAAQGTAPKQLDVMKELISSRAVQLVLLMSIGVFLFNHGLNNWLVELLRDFGMSAATAGYWATLPTVVGVIGSLVIPRLATPQRRFKILLGLCLLAMLATILLRFADTLPLTVGLIAQGIARSSMMTVLILTLVELPGIGEQRAGVASGMFFSAAEVGGMLGPLSIGVLYDVSGNFNSALGSLTVVAGLMAVGAVMLGRLARPSS